MLFYIVVVACLQGLSEFLPISSSGHIALFSSFFPMEASNIFTWNLVLHLGTLCSLVVYFFKPILRLFLLGKRENYLYIWYLFIATLPIVFIGLFFLEKIETWFTSMKVVGIGLCFTALILWNTKSYLQVESHFSRKEDSMAEDIEAIDWKKALWIGLAQSIAVVPGISRSGSTLSTGLFLGVPPKVIFRFSFFLGMISILGGGVLDLIHFLRDSQSVAAYEGMTSSPFSYRMYGLGFVISFVTGYIAIKLLNRLLAQGKIYYFSYYCLILGMAILLFHRG